MMHIDYKAKYIYVYFCKFFSSIGFRAHVALQDV